MPKRLLNSDERVIGYRVGLEERVEVVDIGREDELESDQVFVDEAIGNLIEARNGVVEVGKVERVLEEVVGRDEDFEITGKEWSEDGGRRSAGRSLGVGFSAKWWKAGWEPEGPKKNYGWKPDD